MMGRIAMLCWKESRGRTKLALLALALVFLAAVASCAPAGYVPPYADGDKYPTHAVD